MGRIADALRRAARDDGASEASAGPGSEPATPGAVLAPPGLPSPTHPAPLDLTRLTQLVAALNESSGELRDALATIEGAINDLHADLEVWLVDQPLASISRTPPSSEAEETYDVRELGYCQSNGRWSLAVRTVRHTATPGAHGDRLERACRPLTQCDRQEQLAASDLIPAVVERLTERVADAIARIERVKDTAASIVRVADPPPTGQTPSTWEIL